LFNPAKRRQRAAMWRDELRKHAFAAEIPLDGWKMGRAEDAASPDFDDSRWKTISHGASLGAVDRFLWLRREVAIPDEFAGREVILRIDVGREGELFGHTGVVYVNGRETAGLDRMHKEVVLAKRAKGGESFSIAANIYTGPVESFAILEFGNVRRIKAGPFFNGAWLQVPDREGFALWHDFRAAVDLMSVMPQGSRTETELTAAINDAINAIDLKSDDRQKSFRAARRILSERVFRGVKGDAAGKVFLVGQSHIDMAWLWPRRETIMKCAATMANTLTLQRRYPFYRFSHSQAQGFEWIKMRYPALHRRVRRAAKAGKIELVGGMWVEADLNCAGAEPLARQFLYGQRFFEKEFGVRSIVGWLVDTFGYNWSLPQILKSAGIDYFVSTKPTWNDTNTFPFTTFLWEGPDGSRVLTHIPPLTYGSDIGADKIAKTLELNRQSRLPVDPLVLYGRSDGGGGPRIEDIESLVRFAGSPYAPKMEITTAADWFESLPPDADYPVYCDEMYVETHRGTYTTQARTKRNNRKAEHALYTAEVAASAAAMLGGDYPAAQLEAAWKRALFNQFHDILPGSSIAPVYEDAEDDFRKVFAATDDITGTALKALASKIDTTGRGKAFLVFNPLPRERTGVVEIDAGEGAWVTDSEGEAMPFQPVAGEKGRVAVLATVPPCGWKVIRVVKGAPPEFKALADIEGREIRTPHVEARFNDRGQLARLYDRHAEREVFAGGAGNRLVMFEDIPVEYEAWDIDEWINEKARELDDLDSFEVIENGPVRTVVRLVWKTDASRIAQKVIFYGHTRRIDFETEVDWHERKTLLKAAFPVNVRARRATYEIQFGAIDRPVHESSPWDWARFEVPAQKWADLSQADFGVSLLNDCKYGYDTHGSVMRISLLRSPECPDPQADQGAHRFTYSLLPHRGGWRAAATVAEALDLNVPFAGVPVASHGGGLPPEGWLMRLEAEDGAPVVMTALKRAEEGGGFVARFYEPHGRQAKVKLAVPLELAEVRRANILEDDGARVRHSKNAVSVVLAAWKIESLKLKFK